MGYPKINIDRAMDARPDINVLELVTSAIADHSAMNGCEFEENAVLRAMELLGLDGEAPASSLPEKVILDLADVLEDLEVNCPNKTVKGQANVGADLLQKCGMKSAE